MEIKRQEMMRIKMHVNLTIQGAREVPRQDGVNESKVMFVGVRRGEHGRCVREIHCPPRPSTGKRKTKKRRVPLVGIYDLPFVVLLPVPLKIAALLCSKIR